MIQALETARCVEEGVITDVRDADVGSILGFGFAPFTGGTLSYIDVMGVKNFVALCERLAGKHGPRFAPPPLAPRHGARRARPSTAASIRPPARRRRSRTPAAGRG